MQEFLSRVKQATRVNPRWLFCLTGSSSSTVPPYVCLFLSIVGLHCRRQPCHVGYLNPIDSSYVFEKKQRIPGEPFDIDEEVANFSIEVVDCSGEDEEESELHVCSQTEKQP